MFENIIGHDSEKILLENELKNSTISHAYLFTGKDGIGKKTMAEEFAKSILKTDNLNASPDYKCISRKEDKKDIIVEQIRKEIIDDIYTLPTSGDKKVYIIDDAHTLNLASQNALLKTLEEPPKHIVLILIASKLSAFLPTVLSRVNKIAFIGISKEELKKYVIKNYNMDLEENIINYVDGSIGFITQIISEKISDSFKNVNKLLSILEKKDVISAFKEAKNINFSQEHILNYLEYILFENSKYKCTKFVEKAIIRLKFNGNYDIVIDNMILKIIENIGG